MTELVQHNPNTALTEQMEYAKAAASASLLPQAYRGKPADILIAVGLGQAMGLSPAESLYRIDVIQGKPTASAELIASNVRKAGHKLRVRVDEQAMSVMATIVRSDDANYEHTVVRDMAWAKRMGLDSKDNYKKQPTTMLQWRAVSAVARMACPEALYGVAYTADEIEDQPRTQAAPAVSVASFAPKAEPPVEPEQHAEDVHDADVVEDRSLTDHTRKKMFALLSEIDPEATAETQRAGMSVVLGRPIKSRTELTEDDAQRVIDVLNAEKRKRAIAAETSGA